MRCKWQIENSTWRIAPKILYSPNRTNRSNRQASTRVPEDREIFLSVANEMQMADRKLYLSDGPKILYLPSRTNRSNKTSIFSDRMYLTVLDNPRKISFNHIEYCLIYMYLYCTCIVCLTRKYRLIILDVHVAVTSPALVKSCVT